LALSMAPYVHLGPNFHSCPPPKPLRACSGSIHSAQLCLDWEFCRARFYQLQGNELSASSKSPATKWSASKRTLRLLGIDDRTPPGRPPSPHLVLAAVDAG
jgi:hypothetical protein